MLAWMSGPIWMGVRTMLEGAWLFGLCIACFGCLGCFGLRYSLMILVGSAAVMKGRTRSVVELYEGRVTVSEEFFFLRWRRQCKFEKIERLELKVFEGKTPVPAGFRQINRALSAVSNDPEEKPFPVALAYGESDIQRLAEILREELHTQVVAREVLKPVSVERFRDEFKRVEILESLSADEEKVVRRPTDTEIVFERHEHGIQIDVPAQGTSRAGLGFGIVWLTFVSAVAVVAVVSGIEEPIWIPALILLVFEVVGVGLVLTAINQGNRRTSFVTAGERLLVVSESLFSKQRHEWDASSLHRICHADQPRHDSDDPVSMELQFHEINGRKTSVLQGYSQAELNWIAWELKDALDLATADSYSPGRVARDPNGYSMPAPGSLLAIRREGLLTEIIARPRGVREFRSGIVTGFVLTVIGAIMASSPFWSGMLRGGGGLDATAAVMFLLFGVTMLAGGIAGCIYCLELASREFRFTVSRELLVAERSGWWGAKRIEWPQPTECTAEIGDSGVRVNGRPLQQLSLASPDGQRFDGMVDHSHMDLSTVVTAINEATALMVPDTSF